MRKRDNKALNSRGMVSMTITMVIMVIVTLLVSSYALIVRREQRNVLDRQLSSQAFYSAESGLEDARAAITSGILDRDITQCTGDDSFIEYLNEAKGGQFDKNIYSNVSYTCLLVDRSPESLAYTVSPGQGGILVPISAPSIDKLRINWQNQNGEADFESSPGFTLPANDGTLSAPMLRVTILPGFSGGTLNSQKLINESHTLFLYPNGGAAPAETVGYLGGAGGPNSSNPNQGRFVTGNCQASKTPKHCAIEISNLNIAPSGGANEEYFLAIQPLYKAADIEIEGFTGGTVVELSKAQALVDVTGRAEDVLRRVQARLPIGVGSELKGMYGIFPGAALETSDEICKLIEYDGTNVNKLAPCT